MPKEDMERLNFWVPRTLADSVRQKLLDHKRATRERKTITDICTQALQKYIEEGNEMKREIAYLVKLSETAAFDDYPGVFLAEIGDGLPAYRGYLLTTSDRMTEQALEDDPDIEEYVEVELVRGHHRKTDYPVPGDKDGWAIRV